MWHPFAYLARFRRKPLLILMLLATLAAATALTGHGRVLTIQPEVPRGMLSFEFAGTSERAAAMIAAWRRADVLDVAKQNLILDFGFIAIYTVTMAFITMLAARKYQGNDYPWLAIILTGLTLGQWLAGGFDVMENCALLHVLRSDGRTHEAWPRFASIAAGIKFALIAVGLSFSLPAMFMRMPKQKKQQKKQKKQKRKKDR